LPPSATPRSEVVTFLQAAAVCGAGFAAGFVNAVAGGGTLLSFPALMYSGLTAIVANATNTLALVPVRWPARVDVPASTA